MRESSKVLLRYKLVESPDVASGNNDTPAKPFIIHDMDEHSTDTAPVCGIVDAEFLSVDFGQQSIDILSEDKDAAAADDDNSDDISSSYASDQHMSQAASGSAVLLTHYKVTTYFSLLCR